MSRMNLDLAKGWGSFSKLFQYQNTASTVLMVLFAVMSAWIAGKAVWMVAQEQQIATWSPSSSVNSTSSSKPLLNLSSLQQSHLFGQYQKDAVAEKPKPVVKDAPKSRLNVILVGVVTTSIPDKGLAVIANRGAQATYGINEVIEGTRAKLKAVLADRVIIDNQGRDETVMLQGIEYKKQSAQTKPKSQSQSATGNPTNLSRDKVEQVRERLSENPQEIFRYVRMSQVKRDNQITGYRLSPGSEPALFESLGLKSGDVATHINGQDLSDPSAMNQIFRTISELSELNLTVERDGQPYEIYIEF